MHGPCNKPVGTCHRVTIYIYTLHSLPSVNLALGMSVVNRVSSLSIIDEVTPLLAWLTRLYMQALSVGLLDADVYGPSIPRMMNLAGQPELSKREQASTTYGVT